MKDMEIPNNFIKMGNTKLKDVLSMMFCKDNSYFIERMELWKLNVILSIV